MTAVQRMFTLICSGLIMVLITGCGAVPAVPGCLWGKVDGMNKHFMEVTYGDNRFVLSDGNGQLYSSNDGLQWSRGANLKVGLLGLSHGGDLFMAASRCGGMLISKDSKRWRFARPFDGGLVHKWQFDGEHYLLTGANDGAVLRSIDGLEWESTDTGFDAAFLSLTRGNDLYVAVGLYGSIYTSSDWINWTQQEETGIRQQTLRRVIYEEGLFVAIGEKGIIITSADGKHWQRQETGIKGDFLNIAHGNGRFVAVGDTVMASTDGLDWIETREPQGEHFVFWDVAYGNGRFVVVGDDRTVLVSEDGTDWQEVQVTASQTANP